MGILMEVRINIRVICGSCHTKKLIGDKISRCNQKQKISFFKNKKHLVHIVSRGQVSNQPHSKDGNLAPFYIHVNLSINIILYTAENLLE